ncbi:C40 family peptidase [Virgibacillus necropolis]|nr:C40 family peptidase [Virgibacillus necropolis]
MKKSIITLTTVAVVGLGSMFVNNTVQAEATVDLQNKQSEIQSKRSAVQANLSEAESKIVEVMVDLKKLNKKIEQVDHALKQNQEKMNETKSEIEDKKAGIKALEDEIKDLEKEIEARYEILKERIVSYQKSGGDIGYMDVIFGSKSFGELISRVTAVNKITNADAELMKEQEKAKNEVEDKQEKVEGKLTALQDIKVELEGMEETILVQKEQNGEAKDELKNKKQDLEVMKDELEIKDSSLAVIEAEVNQNIAQKNIERERATAAAEEETETVSSNDDDSSNLATLGSESSDASSNSNSDEKSTTSKSSNDTKKQEAKSSTSVAKAPGGGIATAINAGYPHLGTPYVWNGESPSGFDCSGFIAWAFRQGGISLPSSTSALQNVGQKVSYSDIQPGDLVFFNTYKTNGHIGIYVGGGKFIGAQNSTGLAVADMTSGYWDSKFAGHVRRVR